MEFLINDLSRLEDYIRAFWQFLPISVCYVSPALNILDVSLSFEDLLGFKTMEIVGASFKKLFKNPKQLKAILNDLLEQGTVFNKRVRLISKAGREIPVTLSATSRKEGGEVIGHFFAFLDVSEQEKFEKQLQEKIEELEKMNRLMVGRELRMIELKKKIKELEKK